MQTRIQATENSPEILHIPVEIQKDINEKGFHLYKWISPDEVKLSIQRDFLHTLKYIGIPLGILAILAGFVSIFAFFGVIFLGVFFMFLYLFILSLRRSSLLSKSAFVVLTDSSISLGGKIVKLSEISQINKEQNFIEQQFEEELFEASGLEKTKSSLMKSIMDQLFGGYNWILSQNNNKFGISGRENEKALLLIIFLYTIYAIVMAGVYFVSVLFLWIFGNIFTKINTWLLIKKGHAVLKINDIFGNLSILSDDIQSEKSDLKMLLQQAQENDWKDGLLLKINTGIENINKNADIAVRKVIELRTTINHSKYKDMFQFGVYNDWIKKQISRPLEDILELLTKNKQVLERTQVEIEKQIQNTQKTEFQTALSLQLKRIQIQISEIEKFIPLLENALKKLTT